MQEEIKTVEDVHDALESLKSEREESEQTFCARVAEIMETERRIKNLYVPNQKWIRQDIYEAALRRCFVRPVDGEAHATMGSMYIHHFLMGVQILKKNPECVDFRKMPEIRKHPGYQSVVLYLPPHIMELREQLFRQYGGRSKRKGGEGVIARLYIFTVLLELGFDGLK